MGLHRESRLTGHSHASQRFTQLGHLSFGFPAKSLKKKVILKEKRQKGTCLMHIFVT
jgi:hypothetical protein